MQRMLPLVRGATMRYLFEHPINRPANHFNTKKKYVQSVCSQNVAGCYSGTQLSCTDH